MLLWVNNHYYDFAGDRYMESCLERFELLLEARVSHGDSIRDKFIIYRFHVSLAQVGARYPYQKLEKWYMFISLLSIQHFRKEHGS